MRNVTNVISQELYDVPLYLLSFTPHKTLALLEGTFFDL